MFFCVVAEIVSSIVSSIVLRHRIRSRTYTENSDQSALLFILSREAPQKVIIWILRMAIKITQSALLFMLSWTLASTAVYQWRTALHTTHSIRVHNKRSEYFCRIPLGRVCAGLIPVYPRRFSWPYSIAQNYGQNYAGNYARNYTESHLIDGFPNVMAQNKAVVV